MSRTAEAIRNIQTRLSKNGFKLFDYQQEGVEWMLDREFNQDGDLFTGGILADDPGLGKTIQTISVILGNPVGKTLIVVPVSIINQWRDAITKIWPEVIIRINHGSTGQFKTVSELESWNGDIVITGYNQLFNSVGKEFRPTILHHYTWGRVILDECHIIRNSKTKCFHGACNIQAEYRWGLSGTPIQNRIKDLKSLFQFLRFPQNLITSNINGLISQYIKRRNRQIVADKYKELDVKIVDIPFDSVEEREFYSKVKTCVREEYLRLVEEGSDNNMNLFELLLRLRQATIHPNLVIKGMAKKFDITKPKLWRGPSTKMSKIIELFSNHSTTDKSMIICHYQEEMDLINNYLSKAFPNLNIRQFNGSMSLNQRNDCITSCMRGDVDVLLIQILCGGVGLNLQVFNKVYINTPDWNPSNEIQAIARCHRIGQQQNVDVYKLIIIDPEISSIDGNILNIQHNKRKLMAEYLSDQSLEFNGTYQYNSGLTANDFRRLLL